MLNFNNTLTSKIISLIIAVSFLLADISYAGAGQQGSLRVPVGEEGTSNRVEKAMRRQAAAYPPAARLAEKNQSGAEIQSHPFFKVPIKGGTTEQQKQVRRALLSIVPMIPLDHAEKLGSIRIIQDNQSIDFTGAQHFFIKRNISVVMPAEYRKIRKTLAHELGHVVMSRLPSARSIWRDVVPSPRISDWIFDHMTLTLIMIFALLLVSAITAYLLLFLYRGYEARDILPYLLDNPTSIIDGMMPFSIANVVMTFIIFYFAKGSLNKYRAMNINSVGFITNYAKKNFCEDFAETYTHYALYREKFLKRAQRNPLLKTKFDAMQKIFGDDPSSARLETRGQAEGIGKIGSVIEVQPHDATPALGALGRAIGNSI